MNTFKGPMECSDMYNDEIEREHPVELYDAVPDDHYLQLVESNNRSYDDYEEVPVEIPDNFDCSPLSWEPMKTSLKEMLKINLVFSYGVHQAIVKKVNDQLCTFMERLSVLFNMLLKENFLFSYTKDTTTGDMVDRISTRISDFAGCGSFKRRNRRSFSLLYWILFLTVVTAESVELNRGAPHYFLFVGDKATFTCISSHDIKNVTWKINGTISNGNLSNLSYNTFNHITILVWNFFSKTYNNTNISCEVISFGDVLSTSNEVRVLLQGVPDQVSNILTNISDDGRVTVQWSAPFTFAVSLITPNLYYCVIIRNTSVSPASEIHSRCSIIETSYTCESFPVLLACGTYKLEVLAYNKLGNSTTNTIMVHSDDVVDVEDVDVLVYGNRSKMIRANLNQTICFTNATVLLDDINLSISENGNHTRTVIFELDDNKHFDTVLLNTLKGNESYVTSLGSINTYDVTNITVIPSNDEVDISSTFINKTMATGVLYILLVKTVNSIDKYRPFLQPVGRLDAEEGIHLSNFSKEYDTVLAYDIEYDGRIYSGLPAVEKVLTFAESVETTNTIIKPIAEALITPHCEVDTNGYSMEIQCNCQGHFQVIIQTSNIMLINNILTLRGDCMVATIHRLNSTGTYWVTVFLENNSYIYDNIILYSDKVSVQYEVSSTIISSTSGVTEDNNFEIKIIIGVAIELFFLIIIMFINIACFIKIKKRSRQMNFSENDLEENNTNSTNKDTLEMNNHEDHNDTLAYSAPKTNTIFSFSHMLQSQSTEVNHLSYSKSDSKLDFNKAFDSHGRHSENKHPRQQFSKFSSCRDFNEESTLNKASMCEQIGKSMSFHEAWGNEDQEVNNCSDQNQCPVQETVKSTDKNSDADFRTHAHSINFGFCSDQVAIFFNNLGEDFPGDNLFFSDPVMPSTNNMELSVNCKHNLFLVYHEETDRCIQSKISGDCNEVMLQKNNAILSIWHILDKYLIMASILLVFVIFPTLIICHPTTIEENIAKDENILKAIHLLNMSLFCVVIIVWKIFLCNNEVFLCDCFLSKEEAHFFNEVKLSVMVFSINLVWVHFFFFREHYYYTELIPQSCAIYEIAWVFIYFLVYSCYNIYFMACFCQLKHEEENCKLYICYLLQPYLDYEWMVTLRPCQILLISTRKHLQWPYDIKQNELFSCSQSHVCKYI